MSENGRDLKDENLARRVTHVVNECIRRRADGEVVKDEALLEANPDLMPELVEQLRRLHVIEQVQREFDEEKCPACRDLRIRCPHCHSPVALADDAQLSRVVCSACGSSFGLVDDQHLAKQKPLERVGHFQLLDQLGAGAFGTVFRARDTELDRPVAVKIPRKLRLREEDAEHFLREARAAAQLHHPNIVQVFEAGREEDHLYIVMDLVQGRDLADWLANQQAAPREAAELCVKLADALDHAHQRGVIHRDLKPSNIMIDDDGEPHLMDFGLAKREAEEVTMTIEGRLLGTPAYMSPEQARGTAHKADQRADVYALGVILYELLTGERPFRGNTRMLLHQILVDDAQAPRKLNSRIPKDLETICLKCLEKSADRRYQSARELADELRRFLKGEPIRARPIAAAVRAWRWAGRNPRLAVATATAAGLLLILGIAGPLVAIHQTAQAQLYRWRSYVSDMQVASQRWESAQVPQVLELLERNKPRAGQNDLRGFEWYYLRGLCEPIVPTRTIPYEAPGHVAFSPDGKTLAVTGRRTLMLWDLENNKQIVKREAHTDLAKPVAFSPDGQLLATGGWDGVVKLWPVTHVHGRPSLSEPTVLNAQKNMTYDCLEFSHDGRYLATNGGAVVPIWDVAQGSLAMELKGHTGKVTCVAFSKDGILASGSAWPDKSIRLWDVNTGEGMRKLVSETDGHQGGVVTLAFSPDGKMLASGSADDTVKLWNVSSGSLLATLEGHSNRVVSVAFSQDGSTLASAGEDGLVNVWNVEQALDLEQDDKTPLTLKGHAGDVLYVAFSPVGELLASAGGTGQEVRLWDLGTSPQRDTFTGCSVPFYSRGEALTAWSSDHLPKLCDDSLTRLGASEQGPRATSPHGDLLALGNENGTVELQMLDSRKTRVLPDRHDGPVVNVVFSPNGKSMVSIGEGGAPHVLKLWDVATVSVLASMDVSSWAYAVFSADSKVLATANVDRTATAHAIKLWCAATGDELATITKGQEVPYYSLALSPASDLLVAGTVFGEITIWDVRSGKQHLKPFQAHTSNVFCLAFSPDGKRLASGGHDRTVKLWDLVMGDELLTLKGHRRGVYSVGFSPHGLILASASADGVVKLWRSATD